MRDSERINYEQWKRDCISLFGHARTALMDAQEYFKTLGQADKASGVLSTELQDREISAMINSGEIQDLIDGIGSCLIEVKKILR